MHFAVLVALAVVSSSILGLAAPVPNSHPQITSKRDDDDYIFPWIITYEGSLDRNLDSATTKRDDDSIIQNKRSPPLPAGDVQGTGSDNNQGIASDTGRRSGINTGTNNKDEVTEGASSDNTKRQAAESDEILNFPY